MSEPTTDELLRLSLEEAMSLSTDDPVDEHLNRSAPNHPPRPTLDHFLRIDEAAQILRVSKSWIYQRRESLPFMVRLPNGPLRVSVSKLRTWMARSKSQ